MEKILAELGQVVAVIGAQWGDEGKGKIIDYLSPHFDILARACGGANAGHTIIVAGKKHVFHLLPAGCLHEGKTLILGSGMVIHLPTLLEEIHALEEHGIEVISRLSISGEAHIALDYHREIDGAFEEQRRASGSGSVGTTRRGIGPAYADKAYRRGLRVEDLLKGNWKRALTQNTAEIHKLLGIEVDTGAEMQRLEEAADLLGSCIKNTVTFLQDALRQGKRLLIEGAQGTLLDIDHGTYPYVTSSATTAAGALQGLGLPPKVLTGCIGVAKAYCTRVGGGPFPTEANEKDSARLRSRGNEFGATTGRPRRCGWFSFPDLTFAAAINGFTHLNLTKLDVLDEEKSIPIYTKAGSTEQGVRREELPGWRKSTKGFTRFGDLPENAKNYVRFIEDYVGVPISFIGTGPGREEMILH